MPANGKILDTIDSLYDSLTKTEKKIAKTILSNPQLGNFYPILSDFRVQRFYRF